MKKVTFNETTELFKQALAIEEQEAQEENYKEDLDFCLFNIKNNEIINHVIKSAELTNLSDKDWADYYIMLGDELMPTAKFVEICE